MALNVQNLTQTDLQKFDLTEFLRTELGADPVRGSVGQKVTGYLPDLELFERACEDHPMQDEDGGLAWTFWLESTERSVPLLGVQLKTNLTVECQRCLQEFQFPIQTDTFFELVRTESELAETSAVLGLGDTFDPYDKLLLSQDFDMLELFEDELILATPYVPKHDVCIDLNPDTEVDLLHKNDLIEDDSKKSPFSVLAKLKLKDNE